MVSFDLESALTDPISAYVRRKSFRLQTRELQFYEYRIDLFAFSRLLGLTIAVEMKLLRWRCGSSRRCYISCARIKCSLRCL